MTHAAPPPSAPSARAPQRLPAWLTPKRTQAARADADYDAAHAADRLSGKQLVEEAFVLLEVNVAESSAAEARVKAARAFWKQVRTAFAPSAHSDVRHAVTATGWADDSGRMTEDFLDCLDEVADTDRRMQEGIDQLSGDVGGDYDIEEAIDAAEDEAANPSLDLPPLDLPEEEPEEGYLALAQRKASEAAAYVRDTVKSYTVDPLIAVAKKAKETADDTTTKIQTTAIVGMLIAGGIWLSTRSSR